MKKKTLLILVVLVVVALGITALIVAPSIKEKNEVRNKIQLYIDSWAAKNNISVQKFTFEEGISMFTGGHQAYDISIVCNEFGDLTPEQMKALVESWDAEFPNYYNLEYITSNGNKYRISSVDGIYSYKDSEYIVSFKSKPSSSNSSSKPSKTATCNYCNGTGRVDGEACPWCGGSGKTYDNAFNDILGEN